MNAEIDTIIFDLGGVLVDWKPEYLYRKVFDGDEEKVNWFLQNICTAEWNMEQDAGRTIAEANKVLIAKFPEYEYFIRLYYDKWTQMFSGPIIENVILFKKLKDSGNYKIYALTNWSAEKWDVALDLFPFFNDFDGVVVSGKEKIRKPFLDIFKLLLNKYKIEAKHSIFIDDNIDNVNAAIKLNMNGIHFNNNTSLKKQLKLYNLKY